MLPLTNFARDHSHRVGAHAVPCAAAPAFNLVPMLCHAHAEASVWRSCHCCARAGSSAERSCARKLQGSTRLQGSSGDGM